MPVVRLKRTKLQLCVPVSMQTRPGVVKDVVGSLRLAVLVGLGRVEGSHQDNGNIDEVFVYPVGQLFSAATAGATYRGNEAIFLFMTAATATVQMDRRLFAAATKIG